MLGFFLKVLVLVILIILIRGSLPRTRIDQLTSTSWKLAVFFFIAYFFLAFLIGLWTYHGSASPWLANQLGGFYDILVAILWDCWTFQDGVLSFKPVNFDSVNFHTFGNW